MTSRIERRLSFGGKLRLSAGMFALAAPLLFGQPVSIKLTASHKHISPGFEDRASYTVTPGDLTINNASLRDLILRAYQLRDFQIAGGPGWIDSHQYQITAKEGGHPSMEHFSIAMQPVLQTLVKEKFKLKFHYETREVPGFALTVAKGGSRLQPSEEKSCAKFDWTPYPPAPSKCGALMTGPNMRLNHTLYAVGMRITGPPMRPASLIDFLSQEVGRPVADKTGLKGLFDLGLEWNVNATSRVLGHDAQGEAIKFVPETDPDNPSLFTALQQQLGLQLKPDRASVKVLVIDHAEKPMLN